MAVDQRVVRTQGRVVVGPERGCCEKFLIVPVAQRTSLRRVLTTSLPSRAAQEGVTSDPLWSNVPACNRDTKPHRIRTGGITSLGRFRSRRNGDVGTEGSCGYCMTLTFPQDVTNSAASLPHRNLPSIPR